MSSSIYERLALATRNSVRESLLHLGALKVLSWRAGAADVCVRVGIESLWTADVSLDSLHPENALLRVHALNICIASHPDSPGANLRYIDPSSQSSQPSFSSVQRAVLRTMANERMSAAVNNARTLANADSAIYSTTVALCALRDMMFDDVCAPLAMSLLRAQARALIKGPWSSFIKVKGAESTALRSTPLEIEYWPESMTPAVLRLTEFQPVATVRNDGVISQKDADTLPDGNVWDHTNKKLACVFCTHEPPLPTAIELSRASPKLALQGNSLNLEHALLIAVRARSRARLNGIAQIFFKRHQQLRIHPSCVRLHSPVSQQNVNANSDSLYEDVLQIFTGSDEPTGIDVRIFSVSGGIRVRPYGSAALGLLPRHTDQAERLKPWTGVKQFSSKAEEYEAIIDVFETVRAQVKLNASSRAVCALDIGVSNTLPPGTASVAATASPERAASQLVPPFAPLERRAPRRFLTLSPPSPARDPFNRWLPAHSKARLSGSRSSDRSGPAKRPRLTLTYATTSDTLVFIQESSFAGEDWSVGPRHLVPSCQKVIKKRKLLPADIESTDRYTGTAGAAAVWAVTREAVERRLRRDSLLRAFVGSNVASAAQTPHARSNESGDLHLDSASRILLKVKCEPLPVRKAELLLRGYDAWQVRLSLLPSIFDDTDCLYDSQKSLKKSVGSEGRNSWSVGVACNGHQLTFTYPSANTETVRSFFRDLTRARTAAALARGVPPSKFYRVIRRSPVRLVVGIGPFGSENSRQHFDNPHMQGRRPLQVLGNNAGHGYNPLYTATIEYVYSKGNSGGFSLSFSPSKKTMEELAPLIEEALDASGGQVGSILAGLLERACPVAAAVESAVRERGDSKIRFVTALRIRAVFAGVQKSFSVHSKGSDGVSKGSGVSGGGLGGPQRVNHAVDVDARGGSGMVTVIDVGRATSVMFQHGLAHRPGWNCGSSSQRSRADFVAVPKWDDIVGNLVSRGLAQSQRAGSTALLRMEVLQQFLSELVSAAR